MSARIGETAWARLLTGLACRITRLIQEEGRI